MQKTVTLNDIARQAGVSPSTVSRVVNGSKRVADDKRALVLAAIKEHQYRPNVLAQGLVHGRTMLIGVLAQDIASPFFARMVSGIERGLAQTAYRPILTTTHWQTEDQEDEVRALHLLLERSVDGLIVLGGHISDHELLAAAARVPTVIVARRAEGLEPQCLNIDNQAGAYRATRYLIGLGHTRIAHVTGTPGHPDADDRLAGYRHALADAGLTVDEQLIVEGRFTEASGVAAVEELLARGEQFTAIFAANDQSAYGVMLGLFNHGYRIPTDMSLVGFDDQFLSAYTLPPLTTVHHPTLDLGQAAAESLVRWLDGHEPMLPHFSAELIVRQSAIHVRQSLQD
jgi:LacI family transcriptional regulator